MLLISWFTRFKHMLFFRKCKQVTLKIFLMDKKLKYSEN